MDLCDSHMVCTSEKDITVHEYSTIRTLLHSEKNLQNQTRKTFRDFHDLIHLQQEIVPIYNVRLHPSHFTTMTDSLCVVMYIYSKAYWVIYACSLKTLYVCIWLCQCLASFPQRCRTGNATLFSVTFQQVNGTCCTFSAVE